MFPHPFSLFVPLLINHLSPPSIPSRKKKKKKKKRKKTPKTKLIKEENTRFYYMNTNVIYEIPGGLSRENLISSHVKIRYYLHM